MASEAAGPSAAADGPLDEQEQQQQQQQQQEQEHDMRFGTVLTHLSRPGIRSHGFVNPPVQRGSTVIFPTVQARNDSWHQRKRFEQELTYGICGTQTHHALEDMVARIEGGTRCQITSSGLSACTVALLAFLKAGDHCLLPDSVYGPVRSFADGFLRRFGVEVEFYHASATVAELEGRFKDNTRVLYIESPGSHSFELVDVRAFARLARARGAKSVIDNTYGIHFFQPFTTGEVDVSVQALTKYIVGHSDSLLGGVTTNTTADWDLVRQTVLELGEVASPDDCWLALRGARTLGVRLEHQMKAGLAVAEYFEKQPEVLRVLHPALPACPGHEFYERDFTGCPSLFSVVFHRNFSTAACHAMLDSYRLFAIGASWGGFESLVLPATYFRTVSQPQHLLEGPAARYHVGLEDVADLMADIDRGLAVLRAFVDDASAEGAKAAK